MLKITYAGYPGLSLVILAQFTLEMCVAGQNLTKIQFWHLRSSKVIAFGTNQKCMYDFLFVINSNLVSLAPFLRYSDLLPKNHKFFLPVLHLLPPLRETPFKFMEKLHGS